MKKKMKYIFTGLGVGTAVGFFTEEIYTSSVFYSYKNKFIDGHIHNPEFPDFMQCRWEYDDGRWLRCDDKEVTKKLNRLAEKQAALDVSDTIKDSWYIQAGIVGGMAVLGGAIGFCKSLCTTQEESNQTDIELTGVEEAKRSGCSFPFFNTNKVAPMSQSLPQDKDDEFRHDAIQLR